MCPYDKLRLPRAHTVEDHLFLLSFQAADQQFDAVTWGRKDAARRKEMLHGQYFGGRHQSGLIAVFDDDSSRFQRYDRLSTPHIALQETMHGGRFLQVRGDLQENSLLRLRRLERQNA